jgi:large subunit ribosomal protein L28
LPIALNEDELLSTKSHFVYSQFLSPLWISARKVSFIMTLKCAITGKKPSGGNSYARRGKAKYLGGVGRKVTGKTKRRFLPNLQRVKIEIDGKVQTVRVCVKAIRGGLIKRPVKRKPFQMPNL